MAENPAWKTAIMWYGVDMLPKLRAMTREQLIAVMREAEEHSLMNPLHMMGPAKQFDVPLWSLEKLSGAQCVALMVFGLWVVQGEDERMASGLMHDWDEAIRPACALARNPDGSPKVGIYRVPVPPEPPKPPQGSLFDG